MAINEAMKNHQFKAKPKAGPAMTRTKKKNVVAHASDSAKKRGRLSAKERKTLKPEQFAVPGARKYPIPDANHARNALSRVAQFGSAGEKAQVASAVKKKFPGIS